MIGGLFFFYFKIRILISLFFFFFLGLGTKPHCRVLKFKDTKRERRRVFGLVG